MTEAKEDFIHNRFGYCFYTMVDDETTEPFIYNLYVHEEYRRLGHSIKLLKYIINEIRETGYRGSIKIEAIPKDDSIPLEKLIEFYESLGLEVINGNRDTES